MTEAAANGVRAVWLSILVSTLAVILAEPAPASAGEVGDAVRLEAMTSIEGLPEQDGDAWARMRHGLAIQADVSRHLSLTAAGQLYYPLDGIGSYSWNEATIQRLRLRVGGPVLSLSLGRLVHLGTFGLTRVDGFEADLHPDGPVSAHLWAGRIGHPEELEPGGDLGGGLQVRLHPGAFGVATGYDLRRTPIDLTHRVHLSSSYRDKKGVALLVLAEFGFHTDNRLPLRDAPVDGEEVLDGEEPAEGSDEGSPESVAGQTAPHDPGFRASAHASIPLGTRAVLRAGGRYYGLPPVTAPWSATSVIETIRPTDYGVAEISFELRPVRDLRVRIEGGPTFGPKAVAYEELAEDAVEPRGVETAVGVGATGKAAIDWGGLGLYGTGTFVGGSWYAGGGAGARHSVGPLTFRGEGGVYRFRGLDGSQATVGEARFQGRLTLPSRPSWGELNLVFRTAVGTDRLLSPWWRAGVALQGRLGRARGAL